MNFPVVLQLLMEHTILTIKPKVNPVHFFNYKQNDSLKTQIVCDVEKQVIHLATGYQG